MKRLVQAVFDLIWPPEEGDPLASFWQQAVVFLAIAAAIAAVALL